MSVIRYHMKEPAVTVLGPGSRYVLWTQGCHKRCPGCMSADSRDAAGARFIDTSALAWEIALSGAEGLTISGGEPFLQSHELAELIRQIRAIRSSEFGVIVYSGFLYEELLEQDSAAELLGEIDLLIDGEYISELDDGRGLRGSANQRVIPLTDLYRDRLDYFVSSERKQEVFRHGSEIHRVGLAAVQHNN